MERPPVQVTNENVIEAYIHCSACLVEFQRQTVFKPGENSPAGFSKLSVGWTVRGLQVWCRRHDLNVLNIDFQGARLPANTTATPKD